MPFTSTPSDIMPSQSSQLSFLPGKSVSSSQSTQETSPVRPNTHEQTRKSNRFALAQEHAQKYYASFMGLPPKVRDIILQTIFSNAVVHISRRHRGTIPSIKRSSSSHTMLWKPRTLQQEDRKYEYYEAGRALSILSVSQRLRKDAMPFYLQNVVFQIQGPVAMCVDWVDGFCVEDRRLLKEVRYSDPYEDLSPLARALRKIAARECLGGVGAEMSRFGITLSMGVLRVKCYDDGKIVWKAAP
jgi:hypothetical protein